jgi:hypothetical protein
LIAYTLSNQFKSKYNNNNNNQIIASIASRYGRLVILDYLRPMIIEWGDSMRQSTGHGHLRCSRWLLRAGAMVGIVL